MSVPHVLAPVAPPTSPCGSQHPPPRCWCAVGMTVNLAGLGLCSYTSPPCLETQIAHCRARRSSAPYLILIRNGCILQDSESHLSQPRPNVFGGPGLVISTEEHESHRAAKGLFLQRLFSKCPLQKTNRKSGDPHASE